MHEFLIQRTDGEWFDISFDRYPVILCPIDIESRQAEGWGSHRIEIEGEEISFSDEDPGFHVVFETGKLSCERAEQIVNEIGRNIEETTGQQTRIVPL